jgi:hypothetical protein
MTEEYLYTTQLFLAFYHFSMKFTYQNTNTSTWFRIFSNDCHRILLSQTSVIIEKTHHNYYKHAVNIYKGRETEVQIHSFLNSAIDGDMWLTSCTIRSITHVRTWEAWVGPRTSLEVLDKKKKSVTPVGIRTAESPACNLVHYINYTI